MGEINIELFNVNKKEDLEELTLSLGKSFYDDPFYSWLFTNVCQNINNYEIIIKKMK